MVTHSFGSILTFQQRPIVMLIPVSPSWSIGKAGTDKQ
jgi:hypothetical protein